MEENKRQEKDKKEKKKNDQAFLADLFKQVTTVVTNEDGEVDYSATLCPLFKAGVCDKGKRCKYSHTMNAENFAASNIDIY